MFSERTAAFSSHHRCVLREDSGVVLTSQLFTPEITAVLIFRAAVFSEMTSVFSPHHRGVL
jgi:hypothetical protein